MGSRAAMRMRRANCFDSRALLERGRLLWCVRSIIAAIEIPSNGFVTAEAR